MTVPDKKLVIKNYDIVYSSVPAQSNKCMHTLF
jgi:hypothetical protein